jgi:hypothetical protein
MICLIFKKIQTSVYIALDLTDGDLFPSRTRNFSPLQSIQIASGAHPHSYAMVAERSFIWGKASVSGAKVNNG